MKEPNSRMSRRQQRKPSTPKRPAPQRPQNHSFLSRHRWAVIIAVVIVVAFGVYAEFSSITADNQADRTAETTQSSQSQAATTPATAKSTSKKSSSKASTHANRRQAQHSDVESESSSSRDDTAHRTFNSANAALAWARANSSSWLKAGYSNFHVGQNNDGKYIVEFIQ